MESGLSERKDCGVKTCNKCGASEFYESGHCKPCKTAYAAKYRAENPDKARAAVISSHNKHRAKYNAQKAKMYADNPEPAKQRSKKYREQFHEKAIAIQAAWYEKNKDSERKKRRAHYLKNKNEWRRYAHNRRSRKAGEKLSSDICVRLLRLQRGKCACGCGKQLGNSYHIDHIIPLFMGGKNTDSNIQLLRAKCNLQKGRKNPVDFMKSRGFLL